MVLDHEGHRKFFLELLNNTNFPGSVAELVVVIKQAVIEATIQEKKPDNETTRIPRDRF